MARRFLSSLVCVSTDDWLHYAIASVHDVSCFREEIPVTCAQSYRAMCHPQYDDRFLDREHDDIMMAEDYDARRRERDGWATDTWDGRW